MTDNETTRRRFRRPLKAHLAWRAWEARAIARGEASANVG